MREGVLSLDPKARAGSGSGYGTNYVPGTVETDRPWTGKYNI